MLFFSPLPSVTVYLPCTQYKQAVPKTFVISIKTGDNCVKIGHNIVILKKILQCPQGTFVMHSVFRDDSAFYTYPLDSRQLDIHKVSNISDDCLIADIGDIVMKYVLLAYRDQFVAFPLLHISSGQS